METISILKTKAKDERLMELSFYKLNLDKNVLKLLIKAGWRASVPMERISDIVNIGYETLLNTIVCDVKPDEVSKFMYLIEEELAQYGLKMVGSNFDVYDLKIHNLNLKDECLKSEIMKLHNVKTLGDLAVIGNKKLKKLLEDKELRCSMNTAIKRIVIALREFGIELENRNDSNHIENIFPKAQKYLTWLDEVEAYRKEQF